MILDESWVPFSAFISHKTNQPELLSMVAQKLRNAGIRVNVAEWHPQAGRSLYDGKIRELLRSSDCLVVIMTHEAATSTDIHQEIGAMWDRERPIIPFFEERVSPKGVLVGREAIYFNRNNLPSKLDELVRSVAHWRQKKQQTWTTAGIVVAGALGLKIFDWIRESGRRPADDDRLFTISQAAQYSEYSESSIRRWIREGDLDFWEDDYGTRYVSKKGLDAFLINTGRA